jgi:glycosyltransferase involved in cell wall biosynthesis
MRICFICQEDIVRPQGGTGTYVRNISIGLALRGHDVHVIARRRGDLAHEVVDGVNVHRVEAPGPGVLYSPLFFRASRRKFEALHAADPFDVLHGNLPLMSSFGVRGKRGMPPVVETLHCTVREELRALSGQRLGWLNWTEVLSRMIGPVWAGRERFLLGRARQVISVSEGLKREITAQYDYPADRVTVVPNGVDCARFRPGPDARAASAAVRAAFGIGPNERVILYLGRLMERKRAIDLVRALPAVLERVPNARLVIVGSRNANAERIEALAADLGVRERLVMVDHVPYAEVAAYYGMASVYCLPSAYEGFPFTILEAMASGTPVVASDIPGIDEQISHGANGLLHPVGDVPAIADHLCRVLGEPQFAASMSEAASALVHAQYDWSVIAERTEGIFSTASASAAQRGFGNERVMQWT